jgi:hypothetical protein
MPISNKIEKKESLTEVQDGKHENVAGSVWLNLFMDGSGNCKLPSTPPSTGFSRIHNKHELVHFRFLTYVDVLIWRLSLNLQCDTLLPFYERRHITPRLKLSCALNENTMSETK